MNKTAIGVHHTATNTGSWDGPANEKNVRSDEEIGYYRRIYAWRDAEQTGDRKAHYRFIHHVVGGDGDPGAASTVACTTGIGVLNGARGGTTIPEADRQGVYNHLAAHLRDADIEPPELRALDAAPATREPTLISREQFLRDGAILTDVFLRKQFVAEVKASEEHKGLYDFTISTDAIDRDDDRIMVEGWDFKNYLRNPVVLWAHNARALPIGRAKEVYTEANQVHALTEFASAELSPFADQVRQFYDAGFLRAVSVGFIPKKWSFVDDDERKYGIDFEAQELVEFSAVPVPANPEALLNDKGFTPEKLGEMLRAFERELRTAPRKNFDAERRRLRIERSF